jgi:hypothetical protein
MKTTIALLLIGLSAFGADTRKEEKKAPELTKDQKIQLWKAWAKERDAEAAYLAQEATAKETKERAAQLNDALIKLLSGDHGVCGSKDWKAFEDSTGDIKCIPATEALPGVPHSGTPVEIPQSGLPPIPANGPVEKLPIKK